MARINLSGIQLPTLTKLNIDGELTLDSLAGSSGQILTSAGSGLTPTWSSSFSGFLSTTNTGRTGSISFITPGASSQATWSNYPVGLGTMVNANQSANGTPTNNFQYFFKVANRDFGGGWGGISIDYGTGDFYVGRANISSDYATWHRMANTSLANTFTEPMSITPSGNVTALTVTQNAGGRSLIFGASGLLNTATSVTGNPSWNSVATSEVYGTLSTRVVELLRGISNQTADTLQIQSSAGTVLGGRNALGQLYSGTTTPINYQVGGTPTATSGTGSIATINLTTASNFAVGDLIRVTGFTPTAYNTTGYALVTAVSNTPTFSVSYASTATGSMTVAGQVQTVPQASITARSAATVPLIVRGGGFNMNLQTWLKSDGNPGIIVNPYGSLVGSASANQFNSDNGANFILRTAGTADQRANHYQVVDSSSTILAGFNGQGQIFTGATTPIQGTTSVAIGTQTPTGTTNISITTGAAHGILVGQTVVIAGVTPTGYNGTWTAQSGTTGTTLIVNIGSNPGAITIAGTVTQNSQVGIVAKSANNTPLVVRAAASQVANVLEAQNSSGTVIANITSAGGVRATGTLQGSTLSSVADGSTIATLSASGNVQFRGSASYGSGVGVIGIANATTAPSTSPTNGGILFINAGALQYRGTSGGNATIVNADGTNPLSSTNNTFSGVNTFNNSLAVGSGFASSTGIEIGNNAGTATTPFIDFHSGATAIDYDSRIIASGGTGTNGAGTLTYTAATNTFTGTVSATTITASGDITTAADFKSSSTGTGAPTFNTYSAGVRTIHYDNVGATSVGYTTGIDAGVLWNSIPAADAGQSFKWYGGTTVLATLTGVGILTLNGIQSPADVALPISTANNTTTSGAITIQTGTTSSGGAISGNITIQTGNGAGSTNSTGAITIKSGNGSGSVGNSGNIVIDSGSPSSLAATPGTITIGGTNAKTLAFGRDATSNQLGMSNANLTVSKTINIAGGLGSISVATGATSTLSLNSYYGVDVGGTVSTLIGGGFGLSGTSSISLGSWNNGSGTQTITLGSAAFLSTINLRGNATLTGSLNLAAGSTTINPIKFTSNTSGPLLTAGALDFDGNAFFGIPKVNNTTAGRGLIPTQQYFIPSAATTIATTGTTGATITGNAMAKTISLAASTIYEVEAILYVQTNSTAGASNFTINLTYNTGGVALINGFYSYTTSTTAIATTSQFALNSTTAVVLSASPTNANWLRIQLKGIMRNGQAGSFSPVFGMTNGGGSSTLIIGANSFIKVNPIASTTGDTNIGGWA